MKILRFALLALTITIFGTTAQSQGQTETGKPIPTNPPNPIQPIATAPAITWENTELTKEVDKKATEVEYTFKGKNTSGAEVKITKIVKSCGCQSVTPSKEIIPPGEEVTLSGKITIRASNGTQKKSIVVSTNTGAPTPLVVTIIAPEGVKIAPNSLVWEPNEKTSKTVTVTLPPGEEITEVSALGGNYNIERSQKENVVTLAITPKVTKPGSAAIRIMAKQTGDDKNSPIPFYVRLVYKDANQPAPQGQNSPTNPAPEPQKKATGTSAENIEAARILLKMALEKLDQAK